VGCDVVTSIAGDLADGIHTRRWITGSGAPVVSRQGRQTSAALAYASAYAGGPTPMVVK